MKRVLPATQIPVLDGQVLSRAWREKLESAEFVDAATINSATAGTATLPANPVGFIKIKRNGEYVLLPYYAAS